MKRFLFIFSFLWLCVPLYAQVSSFKLANGLTVIINEDHRTPNVFGCIVARVGSVDDPADATGMAHYFEHLMFKGSENLGTVDWEKEKVHYQKIVELYDKLAQTPEAERAAVQKQINEESLLAGQYTINNEYTNIIQAMGGVNPNAATGHDMTYFHNEFPSFQIRRWLEIQADRFTCPVFRGFQAELETVYEEKNMYSDNPFAVVREDFFAEVFGSSSPYARPIIGFSEHLKTPSLSKLLKFFETYYVPSNMALVLSGDVAADQVKPMIDETLGKLVDKTMPARNKVSFKAMEQNKMVKKKLTPFPVLQMGYSGCVASSEDAIKIEVLSSVLSNPNQTGLLDKLALDGDVQQVYMSAANFKHAGVIAIQGVPSYDRYQRRYESLPKVEKSILAVIDQLKAGKFDDWLLQSVKDEMLMSFEMGKESNKYFGMMLVEAFSNEEPIEDIEKYASRINAVTKEDVIAMAKKYLEAPYLSYQSLQGTPKKDKLAKPEYKPIVPAAGRSEFVKRIMEEKVEVPPFKPIEFNKDITQDELAKGVKFFHAQNPANNFFTLTIRYGVGSNDIPILKFSTRLMNQAGIMSQYTAYEVKREFSKLGCAVNFYSGQNATFIQVNGKEANLSKVCQLLSKLYLMPSLDEKQMNRLLGGELAQRSYEGKDKDAQTSALYAYMVYGKNSPHLGRLTEEEITRLTVSKIAAGFINATQYEASVHYVGNQTASTVKNLLTKSLAFPANLKPSRSMEEIARVKYNEPTIYLVNNPDARQASIYLYVQGDEYKLEQKPTIDGFNEYFGGGFNGIVLQELRELRSFAYSAGANYSVPQLPGQNNMFVGQIGTQGDKALDALTEFVKIINDMPLKPERMDNIKDYLYQATVSMTPSVRSRTMVVENWMLTGYKEDPRTNWVEAYKTLTFEDLKNFYDQKLKGQPIAIAIVMNTKQIDKAKLKGLGKVVNLNVSNLFKY